MDEEMQRHGLTSLQVGSVGNSSQTVGIGASMVFFMSISFVYSLLLLFALGQVYHVCKVKQKPTFFVLSFCVLLLAVMARLIPSAIMFIYTVDKDFNMS